MKVILVNGSPRKSGCTACALDEVRKTLEKEGIETEIFWIGTSVQNCIGCRQCALKGKCVFDDNVNEFIEKAKTADGFVFGTPVYYGSAAGGIKTCGDGRVLQKRRCGTGFQPAEHVLHDKQHAGGVLSVLESGAWQYS